MSNAIETLGAAGPGVEWQDAAGNTWSMAHIGPWLRAAYSSYCRMRARALLEADRAVMLPEQYEDEKRTLRFSITRGDYTWGTPLEKDAMGPGVEAVFQTHEGQIRYFQLAMKPKHGELSAEKVLEIMAASGSDFPDVVAESLSLYPNWRSPELRAEAKGMELRAQWLKFREMKKAGTLPPPAEDGTKYATN